VFIGKRKHDNVLDGWEEYEFVDHRCVTLHDLL